MARAGILVVGLWWAAAGCKGKGGGGKPKRQAPPQAAPVSASASPRPSAAPAPSGAPAAHRNVVVILADDQRADSMACMNKLDQLLGTRAVRFEQHFATTPLCCPARTTILTGRYPHNHGVITNGDLEDGDQEKTPGAVTFAQRGNEELVLAKWLHDAGYRTGFVGKYLNGYQHVLKSQPNYVPPHWDDWYAFPHAEFYDFQLIERPRGGPARRVCYPSATAGRAKQPRRAAKQDAAAADCVKSSDSVAAEAENYSTDVLADKSVAFIRAAAADRQPFFLYLAVKSPHAPYLSPRRFQPDVARAQFTDAAMQRLAGCKLFEWADRPPSFLEADVSDKPEWVQALVGRADRADLDKMRQKQLVSVLATEDALDRVMTALQGSGVADDTVIVYLGDNGYAWGEHHWSKKNCSFDECARVPLVIYDPRRAAGKVVRELTMDTDVAPTLMGLAGVAVPGGVKQDGMSLLPLLDGEPKWPRQVVLTECWGLGKPGNPDIHSSVRTTAWKYVEHYSDIERTQLKQRQDGQPEIELYDLEHDRFELVNLARGGGPEVAARLREMAALLARQKAAGEEWTHQ